MMSHNLNGLAVLRSDALRYAIVEPDCEVPRWAYDYCNEMRFLNDPIKTGDYLLCNQFDKVGRFSPVLIHDMFYLLTSEEVALPKSEVVEFVRFDGMNTPYPDWFDDMVSCGMLQDEFESFIFYEHDGEVAVSIGDVFLYNNGAVKFLYSYEFTEMFYEVL